MANIRIGTAGVIKGDVWQVDLLGHITRLKAGDQILLHATIITKPASSLQVTLKDETLFTLGPNSEMVLDEFVYDPVTTVGKITASIAKGTFRYVTGKIASHDPARMKVKVAGGTIGVRGTDFIGDVSESGVTTVTILSGAIDLTLRAGGKPVSVEAGSRITVQADGKTYQIEKADLEAAKRQWSEKCDSAPPPHRDPRQPRT